MWSRDALAVAKCELADVRRSCNTTTAQTTATTYMYALMTNRRLPSPSFLWCEPLLGSF